MSSSASARRASIVSLARAAGAAACTLAGCAKSETPAQALPGRWEVVSEQPAALKGAKFSFYPNGGPGSTFYFTPPAMEGYAKGEYAFSDTNRIEVRARGDVGKKPYYPLVSEPARLVSTFVVRVKSHDEVELTPLGGTGQAATLKRTAEPKRPTDQAAR